MKRSKTVPPRVEKLQREARNCLQLAVTEPAADFSADLIDEAVKLASRARELARSG